MPPRSSKNGPANALSEENATSTATSCFEAAHKILRFYRHRKQHLQILNRDYRQFLVQIMDIMKLVNKLVIASGSAININTNWGKDEFAIAINGVDPYLPVRRLLYRYRKSARSGLSTNYRSSCERQADFELEQALSAIDSGYGDCGEVVAILTALIKARFTESVYLKDGIFACNLGDPHDHTFVVMGDPQNPNALVLDPWLKYLDLNKAKGYRSRESQASTRKRGFIGSISEYIAFLSVHFDGFYVQDPSIYPIQIKAYEEQMPISVAQAINHYISLPIIVLDDKSRYRGETNIDMQPHGCGRLTLRDNAMIEGTWNNGKLQGKAIKVCYQGDVATFYYGPLDEQYRFQGAGICRTSGYQCHNLVDEQVICEKGEIRTRTALGNEVLAESSHRSQRDMFFAFLVDGRRSGIKATPSNRLG